MDFKRLAARGAAVTLLWQGGKALLQLVALVVLARLLDPEQIGLVTMAIAIVGIANVVKDFGLAAGIVQAPQISGAQINNLLWLNTGFGFLLSLIVLASSPAIAAFYGNPQLATVVQWLAPTFLFSSISSQVQAVLQRRLEFNRLGAIDFVTQLCGTLVAIAVAWRQPDYRALIAQQLTTAILSALALLWAGGTRIGWPDRKASVSGFLKFGANVRVRRPSPTWPRTSTTLRLVSCSVPTRLAFTAAPTIW